MMSWTKKFAVLIAILIAGSIIGLTTGFIVWQVYKGPDETEPSDETFANGAISCDSPYCAAIGRNMLTKGGSVADAAIAVLLCMGVIHSQSMGLGGGFLMVLYNASEQSSKVLNAREIAPLAATRDMYHGDPLKSQIGPLSVAVPGEVRGYWELHKTAGKLPWKDLFQPTIDLCERGFTVSKHAAVAFSSKSKMILKEATLEEIFINTKTGRVYAQGEKMKRLDLVRTLKMIAEGGAKEFYEGEVAKLFVEDLQELGGIITMEDMKNYTAEWNFDPIKVQVYGGYTLHTVPPPGSGALVGFIMKLLGKYRLSADSFHSKNEEQTILVYQRIVEAFKYAFAKRTELGDPLIDGQIIYDVVDKLLSDAYIDEVFNKMKDSSTNSTVEYYGAEFYQADDHGTSHVSVLGPNGDAIAVTSTVNLYFGAMIRSRRTGIIYNDEMDDFSAPNITNHFGVPPSPNNFIQPGKRPLSSMSPSIFTDSMGRAKLVIGAAGGTKIPTAIALVSMRSLWFEESIKDAIDASRLHHQLFPMEIQYERDFPPNIIKGLKAIGHNVTEVPVGASVCVAVSREWKDKIHANADFRKPGSVAGF